jgi:hypothetical protein
MSGKQSTVCRIVLVVGVWVMLVPRLLHAQEAVSEDELFWTSDTLLSARVDSVGRDQVIREVDADLDDARATVADSTARIEHMDVQRWIRSIRWAAILGHEGSVSSLQELMSLKRRSDISAVHGRLTYFARAAAFRIMTRDASLEDRVKMLSDSLSADNMGARRFSESEIVRIGRDAIPHLIRYAEQSFIPRMDEITQEPFSVEEQQPFLDYLAFTDLVRALISTDEDRRVFERLLQSENSATRIFAGDVLGVEPKD